ncbi:hypothetical protein NL676_023228 [Syzygium grande]|nr:hypothetical protein NL676_023228 [Syzygium grande]
MLELLGKLMVSCLWTATICDEGVRIAAQRKLLDELGLYAEDVPVDQFIPLTRMLYKAPSDGKRGELERVRIAAQRKLLDELGLYAEDVPVDQFIPLTRMLYKAPSDGKWGEHELDHLLVIVRDVIVHPNPDEVAGKYVNRGQLRELVRKVDAGEDGLYCHPFFLSLWTIS